MSQTPTKRIVIGPMPDLRPALDRSYHYPPEVLELLVDTIRVQSRQCQRFCGISGLFSARTPLSSILKRRCCANMYDGSAAKPHAAAPRAVPDPSASHKAPGLSDRLRQREDQSHPPEDQGDRGGRVRRIKAAPKIVVLRVQAPSPWP